MLDREKVVFVLVDVQGKLALSVVESDALLKRLKILIRGMRLLGVPILWMEQMPEKLGQTSAELRYDLEGLEPIAKHTFSCAGSKNFMERLLELQRNTVLLAGIEAHVCVYQTAVDLLEAGFEVQVAADAVSSRSELNLRIALERMKEEGVKLTSIEMVLFELQKDAEGERFRELVRLVK